MVAVKHSGRVLNLSSLVMAVGFILLLLAAGQSRADIQASVDRTEIRENESLQLTVTSSLEVSSTLDLFSLNSLSVPQPDLGAIEDDFEIIDRRQSYRVQIENNQNNSVITWDYTLLPKHEGELIIPPITYENKSTSPITIKVSNNASDTPNQDKDLFLEAEVDQSTVYVQQQLIFKVRLYYSQDLVRGELEHPDLPDAMFKQLGKQKEYSRYIGSRRFSVIEREYAVFPQKAGELEIPQLLFTGTLIERRIGRRIFGKEYSPAVKVKVKAPPASFTGKQWLPAQSLNIRDVWSDPSREMHTGDSLTRTITLQALGLEGVQLPPLPKAQFDGLKVYPEPGNITTEEHAAGLTGQREETQAIIALQSGTYTLPEVRIPWWDVVNDEPREAVLPGRVITVTGTGSSQTPSAPITPPSAVTPDSSTDQPEVGKPESVLPNRGNTNDIWVILTFIFMLLWLLTAWAWWRARNKKAIQPVMKAPIHTKSDLKALTQMAASGDIAFSNVFLQWLKAENSSGRLSNHDYQELLTNTRPLLNEIQGAKYAANPAQISVTEIASQVLAMTRTALANDAKLADSQLKPLYPV